MSKRWNTVRLVVGAIKHRLACVKGAGALAAEGLFFAKCYLMTKDYSSTASGPPSLTREGLSVSFVLQMIY